MKSYRRILALSLALLLVASPISNVYAVSNTVATESSSEVDTNNKPTEEGKKEETDSSSTTENSVPSSVEPTTGSEPTPSQTEKPSDPMSNTGEIRVEHKFQQQDSGWVTNVSDVFVVFDYPSGVKEATVEYTVSTDPTNPVKVPVSKNPVGVFACEIPSTVFVDGSYSLVSHCSFEDGSEATKTIDFKVDTTDVSIDNVVASDIIVKENETGYAKKSFSLTGFKDETSGIKSISVLKNDSSLVEVDVQSSVIVTPDCKSLVLTDNAGNSKEVAIIDILRSNNICKDIIFDEESPEVLVQLEGSVAYEKGDYTYYSSNVSVSVSASDVNLEEVSVVKNGEIVDSINISDGQAAKVFECTEDGEYTISVTAKDYSNNQFTKEASFAIDRTAPSKGSIYVMGNWSEVGDKLITASKIIIDGSPVDTLSGIKKISIIKDGKEVSNLLPYYIVESGSYSLEVTDNANNSIIYYLKDFAGTSTDVVEFDTEKPVITINTDKTSKPDVTDNRGNWYFSNPTIVFSASDSNIKGIEVTAYVDGKPQILYNGSESVENFSISTEKLKGTKFIVRVTAEDYSGNSSLVNYSYFVDNEAPVIGKVTVANPSNEKSGNVYFNNPFNVSITAEDNAFGEIKYFLNKEENSNGSFKISESGEYSVKVSDGMGSETKYYTLSELCGWKGNSVIINSVKPTISVEKHNGAWLNSPCVYNVDVDSAVGIDSIVISVNGEIIVDKKYSDVDVLKESLQVDISKAIKSEDSSYETIITVIDNSGLKTEDSDIVFVDTSAPEKGSMKATGKWELHDNKLYTNSVISISGSPVETESGIKSVEVLNGNTVVGSVPYEIRETGEYSVRVEDNVGNSIKYSLAELLGAESSSVVVDNVIPAVSFDLDKSDKPEYINGNDLWYSTSPVIYVNITDDNLLGVSIKSYVDGKESVLVSDVNTTGIYKVNTTGVDGKEITIVASATDKSGNTEEKTFSFFVDSTPPETGSINVDGKWNIVSDKLYTNGIISVNGTPVDTGSGIKSIEVIRNDEVVGSLPYKITSSGVYGIKITDNVNNSIEYSFADLAGVNTSDIVWDDTYPVVYFDMDKTNPPQYMNDDAYWYSKNPVVYIGMSDNNMESVKVVCYIDGNQSVVVSDIIEDGIYAIDTSYAQGKTFKLEATATDKSGNVSTDSFEFFVDTKKPEIGSIIANGSWKENNSKLYINNKVTIYGDPVEEESGIKSIEVLKDGDVVSSLPYDISSSGTYSVRVTDNVGNISEFTFADIAKVGTSDIVWDSKLPDVEFDMLNTDKPQYINDGVYWYAKNPNVSIKMSDTNLDNIKVVCYVDGTPTTVVSEVSKDGLYVVDTSFVKGNQFKLVATATDKSGNISEKEFEFFVDYEAPVIGTLTVTAKPEWFESDGYVYSREGFYFGGKPADNGSGLKQVSIYKNDNLFAEFGDTNVDVSLKSESDSGSYRFVFTDNVGNSVTVNASELIGSKENNFIIDLTVPSITRTDANKETLAGWYNYTPTFSYEISDDNIDVYKVTINGDEYATKNTTSSIEVNTEKYQNQSVEISIFARDKAGNESSYTYKYNQDNTPPSNIKVEMDSPVSFKGSNVYYNDAVDFKISAKDNFYGEIQFFVNGEKVDDGLYSIIKSGEYSFEIKDGLGNSTGVISLAKYFKWDSNNIVIDKESPVISAKKYNGSWITGVGTYEVKVSDNLGIDKISATINGVKAVDSVISSTNELSKTVVVNTTMAKPNEDGSFDVVITAVDNSGLSATWSDKVFVDNTVPVVDSFNFGGFVNQINSQNGYNYFFNGSGFVDVNCLDLSYSSGLKSIWTRLEGQDWVEHAAIESGIIKIAIPTDYKGFIEAFAVDNVGLKSSVVSSVKFISESEKLHSSSSEVKISLPETPYRDVNGNPLYGNNFKADLLARCNWSGLKSLKWGISDMNSINNFDGGDTELNITTKYSDVINLEGNSNGITVSAVAEDWSGHSFNDSAVFSIDKDSPIIEVTYDSSKEGGYYNSTRTAVVSIRERNFDPSLVSIKGSFGDVGSWEFNGDSWVCNITFSEDGDYAFTIDCKDLADNSAVQYVSEKFTVDKTKPIIGISWNPAKSDKDNFYNESRVAIITVEERNFDSSLIEINSKGTVSGWSDEGNIHRATVSFTESGEYSLSVKGSDKAGNSTNEEYVSESFIVDLDKPTIDVSGVSGGVSYKNNVDFLVRVSDAYIDNDTHVFLSGKNHKEIEISGQFAGQTGIFTYSDFPKEPSVDDIYTLRVISKDRAGNVSEEIVKFSVNRFGSTYSFYDEKVLNNYLSVPVDIEISETNVDRLDTSKIVITITRDGKEIEIKDGWVSIEEEEVNSKYFYRYKISKEAFSEDGKYSISILSQALEGTKYASLSEQYDFVIDKTNPEVIVSGVQSDKDYREYSRTVTVDTRDRSGIASVKFFINGEEITEYDETDGIYSFVVNESNEYQSVTVEVIDMAGNYTTVSVDNFLITSNLMIYLINQIWFMVLIAIALFLIIIMFVMILLNRRKDKDEEKEALRASGELYRSSTTSTSGISDKRDGETTVMETPSESEPTDLLDK